MALQANEMPEAPQICSYSPLEWESNTMSDDVVTVRLTRKQASFLQANLSLLAATTRQAMTRPGLEPERRTALGSRATSLESIEDAVRSAMLEMPNSTRKSARGVEVVARPAAQRQPQDFNRLSAA
jgi:hypothetical protein